MQVIRASCSGMWEWKTHARQVQSCNRKIRTPYSSPTASTLAGPARFRAAVLCPRATVPALSGVHSLAAEPAEKRSPPTGVRRAREHAEAGWVRPFVIAERPFVLSAKRRFVGALTGKGLGGSKSKISTKRRKPDASWLVLLRARHASARPNQWRLTGAEVG